MKSITKNFIGTILVGLFIAAGAGRTLAYDHDKTGWFDSEHHHHLFIIEPRAGNSPGVPQRDLSDTPAAL